MNLTKLLQNLLIQVKIVNPENKPECIKIIRKHSSKSISEISNALNKQTPVYETKLIKEEFYSGWKSPYTFITDLQSQNIQTQIIANGNVAGEGFIESLRDVVTAIKREDIY